MIDVGAAARRLVAGCWVVVVGAVLGLGAAAGWIAVVGVPSISCASLEVQPVLAEQVNRDAPVRRFVLMDNELAVLESEGVRTRAAERAGFPIGRTALTATVPPNTEVLRLCYRDRSGERAREAVAALGEAYRSTRSEAVAQDIGTRTAAATAELTRIRSDLAGAAATVAPEELTERADALDARLLLLEAVDTSGSRVLQEPGPPTVDARQRRLVLVSGLGLGLLLGSTVALRRPDRTPRPHRP